MWKRIAIWLLALTAGVVAGKSDFLDHFAGHGRYSKAQSLIGRGTPKASRSGHGFDVISARMEGVEGELVDLRITSAMLESLSIKVTRMVENAGGPDFVPGEVVVVDFNERVADFNGTALAKGARVRVYFGSVDSWGAWGSNASWVQVQKDGSFHDLDGRRVNDDAYPQPRTIAGSPSGFR